jgi:hypothetical protein
LPATFNGSLRFLKRPRESVVLKSWRRNVQGEVPRPRSFSVRAKAQAALMDAADPELSGEHVPLRLGISLGSVLKAHRLGYFI